MILYFLSAAEKNIFSPAIATRVNVLQKFFNMAGVRAKGLLGLNLKPLSAGNQAF